jgi:DNA-binding response OmpR family regulator
MTRRILQGSLEAEGWSVRAQASARGVVRALLEEPADVVVLARGGDDLSGVALARLLRRNRRVELDGLVLLSDAADDEEATARELDARVVGRDGLRGLVDVVRGLSSG